MQIRVRCGCTEEGKCLEWAIVELQGTVETQPSFHGQIQGLEIGTLCRPSQGTYTFTLGYHELSGTKVPLKKPLLVMRKKTKVKEAHADSISSHSGADLEVIGIIRHRILFKSRPKALISKPVTKEKKAAFSGGGGQPTAVE